MVLWLPGTSLLQRYSLWCTLCIYLVCRCSGWLDGRQHVQFYFWASACWASAPANSTATEPCPCGHENTLCPNSYGSWRCLYSSDVSPHIPKHVVSASRRLMLVEWWHDGILWNASFLKGCDDLHCFFHFILAPFLKSSVSVPLWRLHWIEQILVSFLQNKSLNDTCLRKPNIYIDFFPTVWLLWHLSDSFLWSSPFVFLQHSCSSSNEPSHQLHGEQGNFYTYFVFCCSYFRACGIRHG